MYVTAVAMQVFSMTALMATDGLLISLFGLGFIATNGFGLCVQSLASLARDRNYIEQVP